MKKIKFLLFSFIFINLLGLLNTYAMDVNITPSSGTWYNNSNESVSTSNATSRYIGGEPFFQFSSSNIYSQFMSTDIYFSESINSYLLSNRWDVSFTILSYGDYNIRLGTSSCFITSSTDMTNMDANASGDFDVSNGYYSYKNVFCPNVQLNSVPVKLRLYRTFSTGDQSMNRLLLTQYWSFSQTNNSNTNQDIIDNQNQNTQDVIDNQNQNTQDVIDNQNQNTQDTIEANQICSNISVSSYTFNNALQSNGTLSPTSTTTITTDFIKINKYDSLKLIQKSTTGNNRLCFYTSDKTYISCFSQTDLSLNQTLTIPTNASYFRSTILKSTSTPVWEYCRNSNSALNDSITSEDSPSSSETSDTLDSFSENVASDTPITDLLTMPLTLINAYIGGMNSTCTPYTFGSLLGSNLTMPCINLQQRLGSNIWSIIDVLFSIFMIFNISKLFIGAFNKFTTLKDDFSNMYTNDYQPRHGGDD